MSIHLILFMTNNDTFSKRLIQRRAQFGYSQEELSKLTGIAAAQISRYEAGINKPRANIISKIANCLSVPFSWLAYGDTSELIDINKDEDNVSFSISLPKEQYDLLILNANENNMDIETYIHQIIVPEYLERKKKASNQIKNTSKKGAKNENNE